MPLKTHVAAPGSTDSERFTTRPAREGFVSIACTEPVGTGISAVCVERGRHEAANYDVDSRTQTHRENKKTPYTLA